MGELEIAEQSMRDKCFILGFSERKINQCIDYFIYKLSHKEMAEKYNIEVETSLAKKSQLKKIIFA